MSVTGKFTEDLELTGMKFYEEPIAGELKSSKAITRYPGNPVLKAGDVPYASDLVMNAGVTKYQGKYVMIFRNDLRTDSQDYPVIEGINLGIAYSQNGLSWEVASKPCFSLHNEEIINTYDPRLHVIDGKVYMTFGMDTKHGVRGGIAVTEDFENFEVLYISEPENRNFVLLTEKYNGNYIRLDRPFPIYGRRPGYEERFDIWMSESPDLKYWGKHDLLLGVEDVPFANQKLGPGAPPIKTKKGWLTIFHSSDYDPNRKCNGYEVAWKKRYCAGVMLLDIENPRKIVGMSKLPLIAPEEEYETTGGYRNDVIFPTGAILEDNGEVKIYYGSADTYMCLATANIDELIKLCISPR